MAILITFAIQDCRPFMLDPWDPANTPGLRTLSRGYVYCVMCIIVMTAGVELVATRVPGYRASHVLAAFVVGFPIFGVLCGFLVGLLPHLAIYQMTYIAKTKTTAIIDDTIGDVRTSMREDYERLATLLRLRSQVLAAPGLPIRVPWLVPMIVALVGPLVAFLVSLKR